MRIFFSFLYAVSGKLPGSLKMAETLKGETPQNVEMLLLDLLENLKSC